MIEFCVRCEPIPQPRPRFSRYGGGVYFPKSFQEYKRKIADVAKSFMKTNNLDPMTGEVTARLKFYRKYFRTSRRFGDCDNLSKAVMDALNGIVYADDAQIISVVSTKYTDKDNPRIEVEILEIE